MSARVPLRVGRVELAASVAFAGLVLGYGAWVAFALEGPLGPRVGFGSDSALYMAAAREPVWSRDFLAAPGPFMFVLLAKLCLRNLRAIVMVQSALYAGAFVFLAWSVRDAVRRGGPAAAAAVGFGGILLLGLAPRVLQWNAMIATESLSVATLCVVVALGLRVAAGARGTIVVWLGVALVAFVFTRDTNALLAGALAIALVAVAVVSSAWRRLGAVLAATCVVAAAGAMFLSSRAEPPRWLYPLTETVALRIVPDDGAREFFAARGLPVDDAVLALPERYFVLAPEMRFGATYEPLRQWVREEGRATYAAYLASHPDALLVEPLRERHRLVVPDVEGYARFPDHPNGPPGVYRWLGSVGLPPWTWLGEAWAVLAAAAMVAVASRPRDRPVAVALGTVGALAVGGFYLAYHGDALEIDRHSLTYAVQLRVAAWGALALGIGRLVAWSQRARSAVEVDGDPDHDGRQDDRARADQGRPGALGVSPREAR